MNLKDEIRDKSGINEASDEYIHVSIGGDYAEGIFEKNTGKLFYTFDMMHGAVPDMSVRLAVKMGANIKEISFQKLLRKSPGEKTDTTNQIPNLKEIQEAIKKL